VNITSTGQTISAATKELARQWTQTREFWNDAKADHFEAKYLSEMIAGVDRTLPVFDDLQKLLSRMRSDCE
jgi:hypothetical protein